MTRKLFLMSWLFVASYSTAYGGDIIGGYPYLLPRDPSSHRSIAATVKKVVSDMAFLRTEERTIRNFGVKEINRAGIPSLQPGDTVNLILDRWNGILDITEAGGKGGFSGVEVAGTVQLFDVLNKRITLKTRGGEIQSFELRDAVATKLNGIQEGRRIVLEMDGRNRVMDAYRPE